MKGILLRHASPSSPFHENSAPWNFQTGSNNFGTYPDNQPVLKRTSDGVLTSPRWSLRTATIVAAVGDAVGEP
jgi:hypothetical protein